MLNLTCSIHSMTHFRDSECGGGAAGCAQEAAEHALVIGRGDYGVRSCRNSERHFDVFGMPYIYSLQLQCSGIAVCQYGSVMLWLYGICFKMAVCCVEGWQAG